MRNRRRKQLDETALEDYKGWMETLRAETPRGAALVAVAALDLLALHILEIVLLKCGDENPARHLLEGDRPLGTFSARFRVLHGIGLITDDEFKALKLVNGVRNAFAHKLSIDSFEEEEIASLCRQMVTADANSPRPETPREAFEHIAAALHAALWVRRDALKMDGSPFKPPTKGIFNVISGV